MRDREGLHVTYTKVRVSSAVEKTLISDDSGENNGQQRVLRPPTASDTEDRTCADLADHLAQPEQVRRGAGTHRKGASRHKARRRDAREVYILRLQLKTFIRTARTYT